MSARQDVAKGIGRAARRSRFLRTRLRRRDCTKYIDRLAGCGIFDLDYYSLQAGQTFSSILDAASDYVYQGQYFGHSPNPFFEGRDLAAPHDHPDMPPFVWFLSRPRRLARKTANPLWDVRAYAAEHPDARRHRYGPLGHLWERLTPETIIDIRGLEGITQRPWSEVRAIIEQSAGQWALQSRLGSEVRFTSDESVVALTHVTAKVTRQTPPSSHPLVSIVMPTWNRADRLRTAIDSVLAQSSDNWELIVANDGSTDDTAIVLGLLSSRDPRIRGLDLPHRGVSAARNSALQLARGTYVAFLDSDNTWQPEFVETMAKEMQRRDVEAAFCTIKRIRDQNSDFRMFEGSRDHLLQGNFIDLNALVVSRDLIDSVGGFDEDLRRCVDFDLALRIAEHEDIQHVPYVGVEYADSFEDDTRISVTEPLAWSSLVRQKHEIDWPTEQQKSRVAGRTSIVLPLLGSYARHADLFDEIRTLAETDDVELILVGLSVERLTWTKMTALSLAGLSVK
ncbi:MAG: glycosyl transferase family 2, partial [Nocardioidaceae bacterium]|nr:glycosyl transferase family 2 [Nocardioidaceae bacterium]